VQRWLERARKHPLVTLWLAVVGFALGYVAISSFVTTVKGQLVPAPVPRVIQLAPVPPDSLAYSAGRTRWFVTVENKSSEPLAIIRAHYRVGSLKDVWFQADALVLTRNIYRLPLNCRSGNGSRPLVPPFQIAPGSFATFVIEARDRDLKCLFRLSFDTTQGYIGEQVAQPF
jgi:hypothetical protein